MRYPLVIMSQGPLPNETTAREELKIVTPDILPRNIAHVISAPPPLPPKSGQNVVSPPHSPIRIPTSTGRRYPSWILNQDSEDLDLDLTKLSLPTFRASNGMAGISTLGRRTCKNCSVVYRKIGYRTGDDHFCR